MSKRSLLLADDSITIQKVINLTFTDEGFDVRTFGDGDSAMAAIGEALPDVVLADVNMPGKDGYGICEILRQNDSTRNIPVILLVGSFEPFDRERAESVGANAFQTKPFQSIRQLVDQVKGLVALAGNGHSEAENPETASAPPDDIERLYTDSVGSATSDEQHSAAAFDDNGLDDEMIETSYLAGSDNVDSLDFEIASANEPRTIEEPEAVPSINQYYRESQYAAEEVPETKGTDSSDSGPAEESYGSVELQMPAAREPETISGEGQVLNLPSGPGDRPARSPFDAPAFSETEPGPEPLNQAGAATARFDAPVTDESRFEEIDLLDLPPMGSKETVELTTAERAELMGSNKQAVSISPELIEIIVEKVVERLSQKH